jgi:hypothetical protein
MGCTVEELTAWLPVALPLANLKVDLIGRQARAQYSDGALTLVWEVLPARRIALLEIPQLSVTFQYSGLIEGRRQEVQRRFDLATQRGGG